MTISHSQRRDRTQSYRLRRMREQGAKPLRNREGHGPSASDGLGVSVDCGWGNLHFAQTFESPTALAERMRKEGPGRRDIAFYVREPHVALASAPQELFLDPSHTYRLDLSTYRSSRRKLQGFTVRRMTNEEDADAVNRIYAARHMVTVRPDFFWHRKDRALVYLIAEDNASGAVVGTVTGVDHVRAFDDPERGASLWCLAVDPQARHPGIGEALVRRLAEVFQARGNAYLDLSVLHDNDQAISLYEKLGFYQIPVYAIKRKNPINERLFAGPRPESDLNPYARLIVDEARRRGIDIEVVDAEGGFFRLTYGGRSVLCRESLSEMTSAVAMSICDDKAVTRRMVEAAGVRVPAEMETGSAADIQDFLAEHEKIVIKPARGEQGRGVAVGLTAEDDVEGAIERAQQISDRVLVEEFVEGEDLRLIVIDYRLVAAAIRRAAHVIGDGKQTARQLIERVSRRRAAATGGESQIPMDSETERALRESGYTLDDVIEEGKEVPVRRTANLHTGGTIHDVTDHVHPVLIEAAVKAARAIEIPVVGIDLMVKSHLKPDYVFIEANERPGLANHEPQPTAERFIDLLFPLSIPHAARQASRNEPEEPCPA
ncbi:N-acetylglutaminylglutamine synthetase [Amorphus orientalis]|uniref:GNAT-family acetyltransferase (TIGR03103 family) n=1 Tax=Amorphus orientalis TaxID=649198 RepID=A0AAE4AS17_9HYPH|nr:N-acetylglutaminylglutamine synthetase [Amorphus orientalis]MDQ0315731.1 GNAT-family acetyltransferase (TIGR03103 family) [Amorphus orientalis]